MFSIIDNLKSMGFLNIFPISDIDIYVTNLIQENRDFFKKLIEDNSKDIKSAKELFSDQKSKDLFDTKINAYLYGQYKELERFSEYDQYIEGAELDALEGAKKIISQETPRLAISAYHELADLWEVPLKINEFNKEGYDFYLRHHGLLFETICYAIPKK